MGWRLRKVKLGFLVGFGDFVRVKFEGRDEVGRRTWREDMFDECQNCELDCHIGGSRRRARA